MRVEGISEEDECTRTTTTKKKEPGGNMMMMEGGTVKTDEVRTVEKLTEDCGLWSDADAALNPRPHRTHTHTRARTHTHTPRLVDIHMHRITGESQREGRRLEMGGTLLRSLSPCVRVRKHGNKRD